MPKAVVCISGLYERRARALGGGETYVGTSRGDDEPLAIQEQGKGGS